MNVQDALLNRVSSPVLTEPGPSAEQLDFIFKAAIRAPDHARLRPWRFMIITGDSRHRLGDLLAKTALAERPDLSDDVVKRYCGLPLRAPCLIALICKQKLHAKVPEVEQRLSLAAAAQNILLAAYAQGVGAIWRTGSVSYHPVLAEGLGLEKNEEMLGFIYLGTPTGSNKKLAELDHSDFVQYWEGENG